MFHPQEGEKIIEAFLAKVKALPVNDMTDEAVKRELGKLRVEVIAKNNSFVNAILSRIKVKQASD